MTFNSTEAFYAFVLCSKFFKKSNNILENNVSMWVEHVERNSPLYNFSDIQENMIYIQLANYKLH